MLWQYLVAVAVGLALLVWGADRFVAGAAATARNLGISPIIIGLTIVGFGTSAPEMLVSAMAAWDGNPNVGIGNAIGSNIANIGLVLGATALIAPMKVHSDTLRREFPVLFAIMLGSFALLADGSLDRIDGIVLVAGLGIMVYWMVLIALKKRAGDPMGEEYAEEIPAGMGTAVALAWVVVGMAVLLGSSRLLVWGAIHLAQWAGVSDLLIGLTVVAIGTSLPELAASIVSAVKGEDDIAIGNILGSNMFNLLAVLGIAGLIAPASLPPEVLSRDFAVMSGLTIVLFAMAYGFRKPGKINRWEGLILLAAYSVYMLLLYADGG